MAEHMRGGGGRTVTDPFARSETCLGRPYRHRAGTDLADVVTGEVARRILRRAFGGALLLVVIGGLVSLVVRQGGGGGFGSSAGLALLIAGLGTTGWLAASLLLPRAEVIDERGLVLDGEADAAHPTHAAVLRALRANHAVVSVVEPRRSPLLGVRVRFGAYSVLVSVLAFGDDLHVGWTLVRRQVPVRPVLRWLGSVLTRDLGRAGLVEVAQVKAMCETVHRALCRAVVGGREVSIGEAFGRDPPIEVPVPWGETGPVGESAVAPPPAPPRLLTVVVRTEVLAAADLTPMGHVEPGFSCELLGDDEAGLMVRDRTGTVGVLRDRSSVRWA